MISKFVVKFSFTGFAITKKIMKHLLIQNILHGQENRSFTVSVIVTFRQSVEKSRDFLSRIFQCINIFATQSWVEICFNAVNINHLITFTFSLKDKTWNFRLSLCLNGTVGLALMCNYCRALCIISASENEIKHKSQICSSLNEVSSVQYEYVIWTCYLEIRKHFSLMVTFWNLPTELIVYVAGGFKTLRA